MFRRDEALLQAAAMSPPGGDGCKHLLGTMTRSSTLQTICGLTPRETKSFDDAKDFKKYKIKLFLNFSKFSPFRTENIDLKAKKQEKLLIQVWGFFSRNVFHFYCPLDGTINSLTSS